MNILFYQVNVTHDVAVGVHFGTFDAAECFVKNHPRKDGYYSIEAIFEPSNTK